MGLLLVRLNTYAVAYTWDGGGSDGTCGGAAGDGNKWSCAANWSSDIVPGASDTATFNSTSTKNVTIDAGWAGTVSSITIAATYSGTITQARSLTVSGGFSQAAGTFTGSSDAINIGGAFALSGGTFTATSGTTTISGSAAAFTHTGTATFNHNNGSFVFGNGCSTCQVTYTSASTLTFYDVTFNATLTNTWALSSKTLNVNHNLTLTDGAINTGTISLSNNAAVARTVTQAAGFDGGDALVSITSTDAIAVTTNGDADSNTGFPGLLMNDANATLTMTGTASSTQEFEGAVTWTSGPTFAPDANVTTVSLESTLTLNGGTISPGSATFTVTGAQTMSSGTFTGGTGAHTYTGATTISGATYSKASGAVSHGGALNVSSGSYTSSATSVSIAGSLTLSSTGAFTASSATTTISGSAAAFNHTGSATFTHNNGLFVFGSGCASCQVTYTSASTLSFYDVTFNATATNTWTLSSKTMNVLHNLTLTDGALTTGTISLSNNAGVARTVTQAAGFDGGDAVISVSGTDVIALTLTGDADSNTGFPGITMNAANATFTMTGAAGTTEEFEGAVTWTSGPTFAPDANVTTVSLESTLTLNGGTMNLGSAAFTTASTQTLSSGTFTGGSGAHTYTGGVTISGATVTATSNTTIINSTWAKTSGSFAHNNGTYDIRTNNAAAISVNGASAGTVNFYNLTWNAPNGIVAYIDSTDTAYVENNLVLTNGLVGTGTIEVIGNATTTGSVTIASTFDGAYNNAVAGSAPIRITGTYAIPVSIAITTVVPGLYLSNANAVVSFTGSGALGFYNNLGTNTLVVAGGSLTIPSTVTTCISNAVTVVSSGTLTMSNTSTSTFSGAVTLSGGTFDGGTSATTFSSSFSQTNGTFTKASGTVTHSGAVTLATGTYTATAGTTIFSSTWAQTSGTFNHNNGTAEFRTNNAAAISVNGASAGTVTFYNLTWNAPASIVAYIDSTDTAYVLGNLVLTEGLIGQGSIEVTGNVSGTSTVTMATTFDGSYLGGVVKVTGSNVVTGTLTSGAGPYLLLNNANASFTGSGSGTITFTNGSGSNAYTATAGSLNFGSLNVTTNGSLTATVNGGSVTTGGGTSTYNGNFSMSSGSFTLGGGATTFAGTYTQTGGTFTGGAGNVTYTSTFSQSAGTYTASTSTTEHRANITFSGTSSFVHNNGTVKWNTQSFTSYTFSASPAVTYYDFTVSGANSGTWTLSSGTLSVAHNLLMDGTGATVVNSGTIAMTNSLGARVPIRKASGRAAARPSFPSAGRTRLRRRLRPVPPRRAATA